MENRTPIRRPLLHAARGLSAILILGLSLSVGAQDVCKAPEPVQHALEPATHVPNCSKLTYSHYPPTSGNHFPAWAHFRTFKHVVNPGYYVHALEHGAIVFLINCKTQGDCDGDFARLQRIADAAPQDALCDTVTRHRIVIGEDTVIRTRFAAVAWGWSVESECLDSVAFTAFIGAHYAQGPENFCFAGTNFSGEGWCNAPLGIAPGIDPGMGPRESHTRSKPGAANGARILRGGRFDDRGRWREEMVSVDGKVVDGKVFGVRDPELTDVDPAQR